MTIRTRVGNGISEPSTVVLKKPGRTYDFKRPWNPRLEMWSLVKRRSLFPCYLSSIGYKMPSYCWLVYANTNPYNWMLYSAENKPFFVMIFTIPYGILGYGALTQWYKSWNFHPWPLRQTFPTRALPDSRWQCDVDYHLQPWVDRNKYSIVISEKKQCSQNEGGALNET